MAGDRYSFNPQDTADAIASYSDRADVDQSEAIRQLIRAGAREKRWPIMSRAKDQIVQITTHLAILAVVIGIIGFMTSFLDAGAALEIAFVLIAVAVAMLALIELAQHATTAPGRVRRYWGDRS